jgi:glutamine amidotransferase
VEGLHLLQGRVRRIPAGQDIKIPHIGWNSITFPSEGRLFKGIPEGAFVYFVHSYYLEAEDESIVKAVTEYGTRIHASVEKGNVFACQFHPEKSSDVGLKILNNFIDITKQLQK